MLDPIQPNAKGMDPFGLKADFGDRLTFHGGIDAQHVLPFGSVEEVRQHTRRYIQALAPGGGYIVARFYNVQGDVSPQNLVAMRDAVEEFGYYPYPLLIVAALAGLALAIMSGLKSRPFFSARGGKPMVDLSKLDKHGVARMIDFSVLPKNTTEDEIRRAAP